MFSVSALLLDDALLNVLLQKSSWFQLLLLRHWHSQGTIATHLRCGGTLVTVLLQMYSWFWQWNKFENRSIFDEVKAYKTVCQFFGATLYNTAMLLFAKQTINTWMTVRRLLIEWFTTCVEHTNIFAISQHNCPQFTHLLDYSSQTAIATNWITAKITAQISRRDVIVIVYCMCWSLMMRHIALLTAVKVIHWIGPLHCT